MRIARLFLIPAAMLPIAMATPAYADETDEALDPFRECGTLTEGPARLACFDAALAGADAAQQSRRERR